MRRTLLTTALLLGTMLGAQARPVNAYYDLIRPNGHPRSDAIHQADMAACYHQTGASRYRLDTPAYRKCMLGRGYRWMWGRNVPDPPSSASDSFSSTSPDSPPPIAPYVPPPNPPPDPTTGMPIPGYSY
jgi:hypothetical protein